MTSRLESGQVIAARYRLVRPLRAGAAARTWLARDTQTDRDVVLKVLPHDDGHERTAAVELALAGIAHPAVLPVRARGRDGEHAYEITDFQAGGEIGRLRGRPWPFILRRVLPVVDALAHLHDAGLAHGDLKSANVLLDADGLARLADFEDTRLLGAGGSSPGSPYAMSPERHDGAAASVADDVYAMGVLLYEVISGHPPYYPDLTPARVREEEPAPLSGRPEPPEMLVALVARCLAKAPPERPASMHELHAELERCLSAAPDAAIATAASSSWTLQPPPDAVPVRAQWQRSANDAPSSDELRREGFRRGLLAGALALALAAAAFTFFVLPDLVASRTPAAATPATVTPAATAAAPSQAGDLARIAELKRQAEEQRAKLPERLRVLESQDAARWGADGLAAARAGIASGDEKFTRREYARALEEFTAAAARLDALDKQRAEALRVALLDATTAFDAGRTTQALEAYTAALRIDGASAAARTGLERTRVLDDVLRATALGAQAEQAGDTAAAVASYERALQLDPAARGAREALARLRSRAAGDAYATAMAQALDALARRDHAAAQAALQRADRLRPGTPEVAEGLRQVRMATETSQLSQTLARAAEAEKSERWADAVASYREALKGDAALRAAQEGLERSEPRAMLDAELQSIVERPERLFSNAGREVARNVLAQAEQSGASGTRLQQQVERVRELLRLAETPIRVALASDNATDVQVYRVGKLGLFEHRDLELMPGRYTVVGTRAGYRDVRKELNLLPGTTPPPLTIRCEEPI